MKIPTIEYASVKVMRSFDYCHFEISMATNSTESVSVDELRKEAARLADKAVEQYKAAKLNIELSNSDNYKIERLKRDSELAERTPEPQRTSEEKATIKAYQDAAHYARPKYNYEDVWDEDEFNPEPEDSGSETIF